MPHQTFDRSVHICEQRRRVALAKVVRKQGKKHGTGKRRASSAAKRRAKAIAARARNDAELARKRTAARRHWSGEWL